MMMYLKMYSYGNPVESGEPGAAIRRESPTDESAQLAEGNHQPHPRRALRSYVSQAPRACAECFVAKRGRIVSGKEKGAA